MSTLRSERQLRSDGFLPLIQSNDPSVVDLDLREKYPTGSTISLIGNALTKNLNLRSIDLSSNALHDQDLLPLFVALRSNRGVTRLDLSFNEELTDHVAQAVVDCLVSHNSTLCEIELGHTKVTPGMVQMIGFLISLTRFPRVVKPLAYRALLNDINLYQFQVVYDDYDERSCNEETIRLISHSLMNNTNVRSLSLDKCCRGEHCVAELRDLLANNHTLARLSLRDNFLGPVAVKMICKAIERAGIGSMIEEIDLSDNPDIDDEGCGYLEQLLSTNGKIKIVSLVGCTKASPQAQHRVRVGLAMNCEPPQLKPLLPELVGNRSDITVISLVGSEARSRPSKNYLTSLGAMTLAESLHTNTFVHTLDLRFNHIGPDGCKSIGKLLVENPHITSIDLERNPLFDEGIRYLILAMRKNDNVVRLNVDQCEATPRLVEELCALCHLNIQPLPLKSLLAMDKIPTDAVEMQRLPSQPRGKWPSLLPDSMPYLITVLKKNRHVTRLDLSDNITLGDEGMLQLVPMLVDPAFAVTRLVLPCTGITDKTINAFTDAVSANYTLRSLVAAPNPNTGAKARQRLEVAISLNHFPSAVKDLVPLLSQNVAGIESVEFARKDGPSSSSYPPFGDDTTKLIFQALAGNTHVHTIVLSRQRISNRGLGYCCECLLSNRAITSVDLSNNDIGPDGAQELSLLLENNTTLKHLNLSSNPLTESGGTFIAKALHMSNRTLVSLDVSDCKLLPATKLKIDALVLFNSEPAGDFRAHVLERVSSLTAIQYVGDVSTGICTDESCKALQLALRASPNHVTSISLKYNDISDQGVLTILEILSEFRSITSVNLQHNHNITNNVVSSIVATLQSLKHVAVFDISCVPNVSASDLKRIALVIELNHQSDAFRRLYEACSKKFRATSGLPGSPAALQQRSLEQATASAAVKEGEPTSALVLDASYVTLSSDAMRLLLQLLDDCGVTGSIRGANFKGCQVDDSCIDLLCSHSQLRASTSLHTLHLENNQFSIIGLQHLLAFATASSSLCSLTADAASVAGAADNGSMSTISFEGSLKGSMSAAIGVPSASIVSDARVVALVDTWKAIQNKIAANRELCGDGLAASFFSETNVDNAGRPGSAAVSELSSSGQGGKAAGSGSFGKFRSLQEEKEAEMEIQNDALADKPKRTPYFRGQYSLKYSKQ